MSQPIPVNILIGDRNYRLKIDLQDEELLRKTVKIINDKIIEFKTGFAGKDMQDYVAMALLWFATEQNKTGNEWLELKEASEKLIEIDKLVDKLMDYQTQKP